VPRFLGMMVKNNHAISVFASKRTSAPPPTAVAMPKKTDVEETPMPCMVFSSTSVYSSTSRPAGGCPLPSHPTNLMRTKRGYARPSGKSTKKSPRTKTRKPTRSLSAANSGKGTSADSGFGLVNNSSTGRSAAVGRGQPPLVTPSSLSGRDGRWRGKYLKLQECEMTEDGWLACADPEPWNRRRRCGCLPGRAAKTPALCAEWPSTRDSRRKLNDGIGF
jgi:hypothetical protein